MTEDNLYSQKEFLKLMQEKGFIKIMNDNMVALRYKLLHFSKPTITHNELNQNPTWMEFKETYPMKDGTRPLHNDQKRCREKYIKLIGKDNTLHDKIIEAVNAEIEARKQANFRREFRPAWKLMSTYINQEGWTMYENFEVEKVEESKSDYGTKLI